jgi:hypothetical protein
LVVIGGIKLTSNRELILRKKNKFFLNIPSLLGNKPYFYNFRNKPMGLFSEKNISSEIKANYKI